MFRIDWMPDEKKLRRFGWIGLAAFPVVGCVISLAVPASERIGVWLVGGVLALACGLFARFAPRRLMPIYLLFQCLAFVAIPVAVIGLLAYFAWRWLSG